jgi:hypothetical protein
MACRRPVAPTKPGFCAPRMRAGPETNDSIFLYLYKSPSPVQAEQDSCRRAARSLSADGQCGRRCRGRAGAPRKRGETLRATTLDGPSRSRIVHHPEPRRRMLERTLGAPTLWNTLDNNASQGNMLLGNYSEANPGVLRPDLGQLQQQVLRRGGLLHLRPSCQYRKPRKRGAGMHHPWRLQCGVDASVRPEFQGPAEPSG